jgi:DNA polymerase-3 subunit delta'
VDGFYTVGHQAAAAAVHAMLGSNVPHAVLITGSSSVGKFTLALDLAAALLCTGAAGADRPCRLCRTCRMVEHGNHGDLHLLAPSGAGLQIKIGDEMNAEPGTVRHLVGELVLLPVEGGQRVAVVRDADRMGDDAQGAILKTLEEPPPGTTIILTADDEERLLPTIRSRCARIRLGTVGARDVEALLSSRGLADAPAAARLARMTGGRPGLAVAYATAPDAMGIRGELARTLLDLLTVGPAARLAAARVLQARAGELAAALDAATADPEPEAGSGRQPKGRKAGRAPEGDDTGSDDEADDTPAKASAKDRRRAAAQLLEVWRDLARDLVLAERGARRAVRDPALLEELEVASGELPPGAAAAFLARIAEADALVKGNVSPELLLDVLLLHWPRRQGAA